MARLLLGRLGGLVNAADELDERVERNGIARRLDELARGAHGGALLALLRRPLHGVRLLPQDQLDVDGRLLLVLRLGLVLAACRALRLLALADRVLDAPPEAAAVVQHPFA